jgi:UDP-glucose 4-epimerase
MKSYKIGIVGGSGYIGSALADYLSKTFQVKILDRSPLRKEIANKSIEYKFCDILNFEDVKQGLKDVDAVIHTAIIQIPLINEQKRLAYEVNLTGTQNVCEAVDTSPGIKCMILSGTWHVFGERQLRGTINEEFGFRPDKVEDRARLYALSKMAQEIIVRFYDEMSDKIYGVIRLGTVLGEKMPEKTAANIFISEGLKGKPLTPFKHTMYRPMLYIDVNDVCEAFKMYISKILDRKITSNANSLSHIINACWPEPITIIDLSRIIRATIAKLTKGKTKPEIEVIDKGLPALFSVHDKKGIKVDLDKLHQTVGLKELKNPRHSIERIVRNKINL